MDWNAIANWAVPAIGGLASWLWHRLTEVEKDFEAKHAGLQKQFVDFRIKVAEDYVTIHDLAEIKTDIKLILGKLDGKADK